MEIIEDISARITKLRKMKGVSQEELAELIGVSRQTIYKWEVGITEPKPINIKNLCAVFDVKEAYFTGDNEIQNEVAATDISLIKENACETKNKKPLCIGLLISSLILVILSIICVWFGCAVFTTNKSNISASSFQIGMPMFVAVMAFLIINVSIEVFLVVKLVKINKM